MLAEPEPAPPIAPSDFKTLSADLRGFSMKPPEPNSEPEPPAPDRYELTLRLEKGDTIDKMLADIDVPQADRKQIHEKLHGASQEEEAGGRRRDRALAAERSRDQPDAPRVLSLSVRPQPEREYIITRQRRRHV